MNKVRLIVLEQNGLGELIESYEYVSYRQAIAMQEEYMNTILNSGVVIGYDIEKGPQYSTFDADIDSELIEILYEIVEFRIKQILQDHC